MISDDRPQPNSFLSEPPLFSNGTHSIPLSVSTIDTDTRGYSEASQRLHAGLTAWEAWALLDTAGKLDVIRTHYDAAQWLEPEELTVLAHFRHQPPGKWAQLKLRYREIGGNPHDLQCAVDTLLKTQPKAAAPASARWIPISARALYAKALPPLDFVVEDILPVGATLFVGRAKDGKSLACWNLCLAVATGGVVFGRYAAQHGDVLYLALEDGERRAQKRLQDQMRAMNMDTPPDGFELVLWDAPRVGEGLEEALTTWLDTHPKAKLIVVDILEKVRPPRTRNGSVYADDYHAVAPLQRLAQDRNIALIIVHHTHKAKAEDFRDAPSGSMSLLGAADTLWNLKRVAGETEAVLQITGRDLAETSELAMEFKHGFWTAVGDAASVVLNPAHQLLMDTLRTEGHPMTPTMLAVQLDANLNTVKTHLSRLTERGLVVNLGNGHYIPRVAPGPDALRGEQLSGETRGSVKPEDPPSEGIPAPMEVAMAPSPHDTPLMFDATEPEQAEDVLAPEREALTTDPGLRVSPVSPNSVKHGDGHDQPSINRHHTGVAHGMVIPCAICGGTARWNDHGTSRCSQCWPPRS